MKCIPNYMFVFLIACYCACAHFTVHTRKMNAEEETATLENLSINTMYLNDAVLLINECQSYTILYKIYFSMCAALTKIETCHIQAHEVCRIHACTIQHIYCIANSNKPFF